MRKTYQFKMYNSKQNKHLHRQIDHASSIYNHCIALHKRYYRRYKKHLNRYQLHKHLTKLKRFPKHSNWNQINSQAIQNIADRIEAGYQLFFNSLKSKDQRRVSPPSFRKRSKYKSITLKQTGYKLLEDNKVRIGKRIYKFHKSREIDGTIKTVTIKRDSLGDIYLFFSCVVETNESVKRTMTGKIAGLDFGLKTFLTASDGTQIESPLFYKQGLRKIKQASNQLSSKKKGSNNRKKARLSLARTHRKVANQRKDHHFKLSKLLVDKYDFLFFEDLNLDGMKQLWGRKVSDLAFDSFIKVLHHMATKSGSEVHHVDRWFPSSKLCHKCGAINDQLNLRDRSWTCACGENHDRDLNAAINILLEGASSNGLGDVRPVLAPAIAA